MFYSVFSRSCGRPYNRLATRLSTAGPFPTVIERRFVFIDNLRFAGDDLSSSSLTRFICSVCPCSGSACPRARKPHSCDSRQRARRFVTAVFAGRRGSVSDTRVIPNRKSSRVIFDFDESYFFLRINFFRFVRTYRAIKVEMEKPCRYDLSAIKKSLELAETLASVSLMTPPAARRRLQARSVELGLIPGQPYEPPRELLLYLVR